MVHVPRSSGDSFHRDQVLDGRDRNLCTSDLRSAGMAVEIVEGQGRLDEDVDLESKHGGMPEREDLKVFLLDPSPSFARIRECVKGNRRARLKAEVVERAKGRIDVRLIQTDDQIEIRGSAQVAVKHNRDAAHHNVPDSRFAQLRQEKLDLADHFASEFSSGGFPSLFQQPCHM